jgi:hypothetical protein
MQIEFVHCSRHHIHIEIVNLCAWGGCPSLKIYHSFFVALTALLESPVVHAACSCTLVTVITKLCIRHFLHVVQHIRCSFSCLAFQCFRVNSGVTGRHPTICKTVRCRSLKDHNVDMSRVYLLRRSHTGMCKISLIDKTKYELEKKKLREILRVFLEWETTAKLAV